MSRRCHFQMKSSPSLSSFCTSGLSSISLSWHSASLDNMAPSNASSSKESTSGLIFSLSLVNVLGFVCNFATVALSLPLTLVLAMKIQCWMPKQMQVFGKVFGAKQTKMATGTAIAKSTFSSFKSLLLQPQCERAFSVFVLLSSKETNV